MRATTHVFKFYPSVTSLAEIPAGEWREIAIRDNTGTRDAWLPYIPGAEFHTINMQRNAGLIVTTQQRGEDKRMRLLAMRVPQERVHLLADDAHLRDKSGNTRPRAPANRIY